MLAEALKEILAEVRLQKEAQEVEESQNIVGATEKEAGKLETSSMTKISSEDAEYLKSKLSMLGLGKYAAYVDEINDVAAELVRNLISEMEKVASEEANPFKVSDRVDISSSVVDPITKFALS